MRMKADMQKVKKNLHTKKRKGLFPSDNTAMPIQRPTGVNIVVQG